MLKYFLHSPSKKRWNTNDNSTDFIGVVRSLAIGTSVYRR
jgi:hypothetical protein